MILFYGHWPFSWNFLVTFHSQIIGNLWLCYGKFLANHKDKDPNILASPIALFGLIIGISDYEKVYITQLVIDL